MRHALRIYEAEPDDRAELASAVEGEECDCLTVEEHLSRCAAEPARVA
jgi:hypothetical protein